MVSSTVRVYVDGSCRNNPGPSGIGVVVTDEDDQLLFEGGFYFGIGTNNSAELMAVLQGLEYASKYGKTIIVYTDSAYVNGLLTQGWNAKANAELVSDVRAAFIGHVMRQIPRCSVSGHARADELAKAASRYQTDIFSGDV